MNAEHGCVNCNGNQEGEVKANIYLGRTTDGKIRAIKLCIGESHEPGLTLNLMSMVVALGG